MIQVTKILGTMSLGTTLLVMPIIAKADLTILNYTDQPSTSVINNTMCSSGIPGGVTPSKDATGQPGVNVVPQWRVNLACITNQKACRADVYMTNNCSGPLIATVILNTSTGISSITMKNPGYSLSGAGFNLELHPTSLHR